MRLFSSFLAAALLLSAPLASQAAPASALPPTLALSAPATTPWLTSLDEAMAQAKATGRPIMMVFEGTDWCKPCILLKKDVFETPEFEAFAKQHLVQLLVAFPRQKKNQLSEAQQKANDNVASRFNREGEFPLVVVVDTEGKVLARSVGYREGGPSAYIAHLQELVPSLK